MLESAVTPLSASEEQVGLAVRLFSGDRAAVEEHLRGGETAAVRPVQADGTTRLVAISLHQRRARTWKSDAVVLGRAARAAGIPIYFERIASGNGVRGWIFFLAPTPLDQAHATAEAVLAAAGEELRSLEGVLPDGNESLELPLHPRALSDGNGVFVEASRGLPVVTDQWALLATVRFADGAPEPRPEGLAAFGTARLALRRPLPHGLASRLADALVFPNAEHQRKAAANQSLKGTRRRVAAFERRADGWLLPRGAAALVGDWCGERGMRFEVLDGRYVHAARPFAARPIEDEQAAALAAVLSRTDGVLVGRDGVGRAQVALVAAARRGVPTLVCVPNHDRLQHWQGQATIWLGLEPDQIASAADVARKPDALLTVAPYPAVERMGPLVETRFGFLVLDDCMRVALPVLLGVLHAVPAAYVLGISDQPRRVDGMDALARLHLGGPLHRMEDPSGLLLDVQIRSTHFRPAPETPKDDPSQPALFAMDAPEAGEEDEEEGGQRGERNREWNRLLDALARDEGRNTQIVRDVVAEAREGKSCLVFTGRREHAIRLADLLARQGVEVGLAHGKTPSSARYQAQSRFTQGDAPVLVVTENLAANAMETPRLERVFLGLPVKEGPMRTYLTRLTRRVEGRPSMRLYDYVDDVARLEPIARARHRLYRKEYYTTLNPDATQLRLPFESD